MGLGLIMKRQVFAIIQSLAVGYEEKFGKRKGLTPLITNQLLAEALISRGLLPDEFLENEYGSPDPLVEGFPYRGFRSEDAKNRRSQKKAKEDASLKELEQTFENFIRQWKTKGVPQKSKEYYIKKAKKYVNLVPNAQEILEKATEEGILNEPET